MIKRKIFRMSDRASWGKEESSGGEIDELIPRKIGHPDHHRDDDDDEDEDDGVQHERQEQTRLPQISEHRRKEDEEEDKKQERFPGNRTKIRSKVNKIVLLPLRQFNKHREHEKKKAANRRNISAPFPYDGEDFGDLTLYHSEIFIIPQKSAVISDIISI
ncbi:uncharacterized protein LOC110022343 [Phalaenopsis equestris]|uniref:uncharacterized protein LOC110022343 n=1 Tax=Phalaenopsis equestris TaxID=78828 RepID=UPI0009E27767|nr:uncharacterized protein LOC110022343 [Phalaenopsis equestris]